MPFEAPLLTEPVFTPPLTGCTAENIENFVDTEQGNSGFLLFTLFISILRCFFVQPSQAFIYRAKSYYCCRMLTHFLLKVYSFFSSQEAIRDVHVKGIMYRAVEADIGNAADFYITLI